MTQWNIACQAPLSSAPCSHQLFQCLVPVVFFLFFIQFAHIHALFLFLFPLFFLSLSPFKKIYSCIWLHQVLVVVCGFFSCCMWDLAPCPGIEPGPPALGAWGLGHWTTREVPLSPFNSLSWLPLPFTSSLVRCISPVFSPAISHLVMDQSLTLHHHLTATRPSTSHSLLTGNGETCLNVQITVITEPVATLCPLCDLLHHSLCRWSSLLVLANGEKFLSSGCSSWHHQRTLISGKIFFLFAQNSPPCYFSWLVSVGFGFFLTITF